MVSLTTLANSNNQVTKSNDYYSVIADLTISQDVEIAAGEELLVTNKSTFTIASGRTFTIASGGTLKFWATLKIEGVVINEGGTLIGSGTFTNNGLVLDKDSNNDYTMIRGNSQTLNNNFTIDSSETLTIASGQTLTITSGGTLTSTAGTIDNDGTIECSGTIATGSNFTGSSTGEVEFASVAAYDNSVATGLELGTTLGGEQ